MKAERLGIVIGGSLVEGLVVRLEHDVDISLLSAGKFVSIKGNGLTFFSLITNLSLESSSSDVLASPPGEDEKIYSWLLKKNDLFVKANIRPMLALTGDGNSEPVKTIPTHFSGVHSASSSEIGRVFGKQSEDSRFFSIGSPFDMEAEVCLDLERFVERSNGIFGKTGTGKTFITRIILAGLVSSSKGINLVFDMHSEYGIQARSESGKLSFVKGLKSLFPNKVAIFSLDPEATRKRGCAPDVEVQLSYQDVLVEDVLLLADELVLHSTALEAAYLLSGVFGKNWLSALLEHGNDMKGLAEKTGAHQESLGALYRKLKRLERFPFLEKNVSGEPVVQTLLEYLDRGIHVVLEFGRQTSMLGYLLIASIITRRIHKAYVEKTEKFLSTQKASDEPRKLVITIEEAHKFLNPVAAKQTIFGMIAREMRKYYVSLLIVDQRPSGIDSEVLSQLGTKLVAQLSDERDINAVLTGVSNSGGIRAILATLGSKKQAMIMGHAVPMPVVVRTREYDETFYKILTGDQPESVKDAIDELF